MSFQSDYSGVVPPRYDVEAVKAAVSMPSAIERYADPGRRRGRCPCPIHGGKDDNLSYTDTQFHCFVCGTGGDVISFVMKLFDLSFSDAVRKLGEDFGVSPGVDPHAVEKRQADNRRREVEKERDKANFRKLATFYRSLFDYPESALRKLFICSLSNTLGECSTDNGLAGQLDADAIIATMKERLDEMCGK